MALTRITKGVIKPNENYDTHNIVSTGIVTSIGLDVNGNADISGSLSVGGVLTYEDVTSIDSIGIITARTGLVSPYADIDDFVSVGSNIHLGNAGVITATSFVGSGAALTGIDATAIKDSGGNVKIQAQASGAMHTGIHTFSSGAEVGSNIKLGNAGVITATTFKGDGDFVELDVDGHTNLDNVNVAGVSTFAGTLNASTVSSTAFIASGDLDVDGHTFLDNVSIAGVTTVSGILDATNTPASIRVAQDIQHKGDADTKITFPAADQISFETGGSNRLKIHTYSSNNNVEVDASSHLSLADNGSNGRFIYIGDGDASSTGYMHLQPGGGSQGFGGGIRLYSHSNSTNAGGVYIGKSHASSGAIIFGNGGMSPLNEYLRIASSGNVIINIGDLTIPDSIIHGGDTNTKIRFPAADTISMEVAGSEVFKIVPDAAHGSSQSIRLRTTHTIDGAAVNMGGTKAYSAGIIRGLVNIRDGNAYNVTDNGGGLGFSAIYNNGGSHTTMSQIEGVKANNTDGNYEGAIKFSTRHNLGNMVEKARIGLNGLSFQGDTAAANCLDDYEEGSWTPAVAFDVGGGSISYGSRAGSYVKIGRMVHLQYYMVISSGVSSSDYFARLALPFTGISVQHQDARIRQWNSGNSDWFVSLGGANPVFFKNNATGGGGVWARGDSVNGHILSGQYTLYI